MSYSRITKLFHNFFTTSKDVANCECVFLFHCVSLSILDCTSPCPCVFLFLHFSLAEWPCICCSQIFFFLPCVHTLKSFLNKWGSWTSRLFEQAHVLDYTAHVLRMVQHTTYHYFICIIATKWSWLFICISETTISPSLLLLKPNEASPNQFICILAYTPLFYKPTMLIATYHDCHPSNKWDWSFGFA